MPKEIKTKHTVKDIKILDKAASGTAHVKNAFVKSKEAAENTQQATHDNAENYATDKMSGGAKSAAREAAGKTKNALYNPRQKAADNVNKAKEQFKKARQQLPKARKHAAEQAKQTADNAAKTADTLKGRANQARKTAREAQKAVMDAKRTLQQTRQTVRQSVQTAKQTVKTGKQAEKAIKTAGKTAKSTAKGTIKTAKKSVKTAERTAKTTVKTAQQTAKAAQKSAQAAAKAAKLAAQTSKAAAKAAVQTAKAASKVIIAMVKAAIAAIKGLVALIAAGGWIAVLIIIIICLIGLLLGSVFGIFFSSEDGASENGMTMKAVVSQINVEFTDELNRIRRENAHDDYDITASRAVWRDVLAVYAVKTNTDRDNPLEVATLDDEKAELLRTIFWDMNVISYSAETVEREETVIVTDEDGKETEQTKTYTRTVLHITVTGKTADEMAVQYGFTAEQMAQLEELLNPEFDEMWSAVLYGSFTGSADIVEVAASQIGNVGGQPYWSWYGFGGRVEWCATFVSWCANECGYIDAGIIPKFAACQSQGVTWFKAVGQWQDNSYTPNPGDIIFFDWNGDGSAQHVGIVEYAENGVVHTIEGNTGNSCARRSYTLGSGLILGYGTPNY